MDEKEDNMGQQIRIPIPGSNLAGRHFGRSGHELRQPARLDPEVEIRGYLMSVLSHLANTDSHKIENIAQSQEYSLLQVAANVEGADLNLVQLGNPWGRGAWEGKFPGDV